MTATCSQCGSAYDPLHDEPTAPATSNDRHRRAAIAGALAVLESKRRQRTGGGEGEQG